MIVEVGLICYTALIISVIVAAAYIGGKFFEALKEAVKQRN